MMTCRDERTVPPHFVGERSCCGTLALRHNATTYDQIAGFNI
jgi:hypothetical protein